MCRLPCVSHVAVRKPESLAFRRGPSTITPWHGPARDFNYTTEVQPVLDRHCVVCHDYGKEPGQKQILSGDMGLVFNASYVTLMARSPALWRLAKPGEPKPLVSTVGSGPLPVVPPYSWGSHRSRLIDLLRAGHEGVKLSPEELDRIITWIDLNAPYYPFYEDYYTGNTWGRSPLDHRQLLRLGQLVSAAPDGKIWGWNTVTAYIGGSTPPGSLMASGELPVNFTRPERSACLRAFTAEHARICGGPLARFAPARRCWRSILARKCPDFSPASPTSSGLIPAGSGGRSKNACGRRCARIARSTIPIETPRISMNKRILKNPTVAAWCVPRPMASLGVQ